MKVALCLSGQLRCFNHPMVIESFNKTFSDLDYDIFISTWGDMNITGNIKDDIESVYGNIKSINVENYDEWFQSIDDNLRNISQQPNPPHKPTSLPQLYMIYKCNELKKKYEHDNGITYDIVFRVRPDLLFVNKVDITNFNNNTVFNINFGKAYHPNRIYDIFFYGDSKTMDTLSNSFLSYVDLVNHDFDNRLNKVDACRLLYLQCYNNNINVQNVNNRLCEVYRGEDEKTFLHIINYLGYDNK